MKAIILTVLIIFGLQTQALAHHHIDDLNLEQQEQLIATLDQMDSQTLVAILNQETLEWYFGQTQRPTTNEFIGNTDQSLQNRPNIDFGGFDDENAPTFLNQ